MTLGKSKDRLRKPDDKEQSKLFIKKAREMGADVERSGADELLGLLHSKPPEPRTPSRRKRR
jgi:hypothetical protein